MSKFYYTAKIVNGKINYHPSFENFRDGEYLVGVQLLNPKANVKDYRAAYFAKIDIIKDEVGEDRYSIHNIVKDEVLSDMLEKTPQLFNKIDELSTKNLKLEGWTILLERLDLWTFIEYNIILP
jgi:hypothetical protein